MNLPAEGVVTLLVVYVVILFLSYYAGRRVRNPQSGILAVLVLGVLWIGACWVVLAIFT